MGIKKSNMLQNIKLCNEKLVITHNSCTKDEVKLNSLCIELKRLTYRQTMSKNFQQQACRNAECGQQYLEKCEKWMNSRKKYGIHSNVKSFW